MAEVRLGRAEMESGRLPKVCMVCGKRASVKRKKSFSWTPPSVMLLGGALLSMIMAKRMKIVAPLCQGHRNHWLMRSLLVTLGFVAALLVGAIILFVSAVKSGERGPSDTAIVAALSFGGLLFLAWIVMAIVLQHTAIRATEITDRSLTLRNVSPSFISALRDLRDQRRTDTAGPSRPAKRRPQPIEIEEDDDD
jgi:small-conductance mechanosensitive channel